MFLKHCGPIQFYAEVHGDELAFLENQTFILLSQKINFLLSIHPTKLYLQI
jgi:hypothetical protein